MGGRHAGPAGPRRLTRYANRKLYDPAAGRYVTLDDVAAMVARGEELRVEERGSRDDITALVLAQAVLEGIRQHTARIPHAVLARLLRLGRDRAFEAVTEWTAQHEAGARARDEAERIASDLLRQGRLSIEEALALRQDVADTVQRLVGDAQRGIESRVHGWLERAAHEAGAVGPALAALRQRWIEHDGADLAAPGEGAATRSPTGRARKSKGGKQAKPARSRTRSTKVGAARGRRR